MFDREIYVFPNTQSLPILRRIAYGSLVIFGSMGLFFVFFLLLVHITDARPRPANSPHPLWLVGILIYSMLHVFSELRRFGPLPRLKWLAFLLSVAFLCFHTTLIVHSRSGAVGYIIALAFFSLILFVARLLVIPLTPEQARHPPRWYA